MRCAAGVVAVVRSHPLEPQPYTGMTPLISGEVAEDLANYLVRFGAGGNIVCSAGGSVVVVRLPCSGRRQHTRRVQMPRFFRTWRLRQPRPSASPAQP